MEPERTRRRNRPRRARGTTTARGGRPATGALQIFNDFPNAPLPGHWYGAALANSLAGFDLTPGPPDPGPIAPPFNDDIIANFNGAVGQPDCIAGPGWYYGLDSNPEPGQIDFLDTFMHEVAHGLGFQNFANEATGTTPLDLPDVYMANTFDLFYGLPWNFDFGDVNVSRLLVRLSAVNTGNVVWTGDSVTANAGQVLGPFQGLRTTGNLEQEIAFGTAAFGPPATDENFGGEIVLVDDGNDLGGAGTVTDGCEPFVNDVAGRIALVDRGACTFVTKVANAQAAGATGVIVANTQGRTEFNLGGSDPSITIPSIGIGNADGDAIKAALPGVSVEFFLDPTRQAGTNQGFVRLYAPGVVALGSSISHFDTVASPDLLMEPFITPGPFSFRSSGMLGSPLGIAPRACAPRASRSIARLAAVAPTTANGDPGISGVIFSAPTMTTSTETAMVSAWALGSPRCCRSPMILPIVPWPVPARPGIPPSLPRPTGIPTPGRSPCRGASARSPDPGAAAMADDPVHPPGVAAGRAPTRAPAGAGRAGQDRRLRRHGRGRGGIAGGRPIPAARFLYLFSTGHVGSAHAASALSSDLSAGPLTMSFFAELKRRNVYRVALLYVVVAWLVLQVTDVLTSLLSLPGWTGKLVFALLLIGFPLALVLAWAFELTPEGVKREIRAAADAAPAEGRRNRPGLLAAFVLAVLALGYFGWHFDRSGDGGGSRPVKIRSIAVLPLTNLMNDPAQSYFVAGMHEALITELSKIDVLKVISRTSAMRYQDAEKSVPEIGRELGVEAVVEGSVLRAGDAVRISVQLIEAASDRHLWADNFDRQLSDILALYSEVTREIASQIRVTLTADEKADIVAASTVNPEVYELYLKGRYLCDNWSPEEVAQGIRLLEEAVRAEPGNAPAQAQLALCLQYSAFFGYQTPSEVTGRAEATAMAAVRLDDRLAEGHVALAGVLYYLKFEPRAAMKSLETALELDPTSIRALLHASWLQGESGQFEAAFERTRRALSLDPLSTVVNDAMGQLFYLSRDYPAAERAYRKALDLDLSDPSLHYHLAWPLEQMGRFDEAIALHRRAVELSGGAPLYRAALAYAHGLAGAPEEARRILAELLQGSAPAPYDIALIHVGLGETEAAVDWLEQSYEARDSHLIYINRDPRFDPLRKNPRFIRLVEIIGWPEGDSPLPAGA